MTNLHWRLEPPRWYTERTPWWLCPTCLFREVWLRWEYRRKCGPREVNKNTPPH